MAWRFAGHLWATNALGLLTMWYLTGHRVVGLGAIACLGMACWLWSLGRG